jgi:hypothetical protein
VSSDAQANDPHAHGPAAGGEGPDFVAPESSAWAEPLDSHQDYPTSADDTSWMNSEASRYSWTNPLTGGNAAEAGTQFPMQTPAMPAHDVAPSASPAPAVPTYPYPAPPQPNAAQPYPAQPYPVQPYPDRVQAYPAPPQPNAAQPYPAQPYLAQRTAGPAAGADPRPERVGAGLAAMLGAIFPGLIAAWFVADIGILRIVVLFAMIGLAGTLYRAGAGGTLRRGRAAFVVVLGLATVAFWAVLTISPWWAFGSALEPGERVSFTFTAAFSISNLANNLGSFIVCLIAYAVALSWTAFRPGSRRGVG